MDEQRTREFESLSYEEAMRSLDEIVTQLERGELTLENSMHRFEDGIALSRVCARRLAAAEARIQTLVEGEGGELALEPFSHDANAAAATK